MKVKRLWPWVYEKRLIGLMLNAPQEEIGDEVPLLDLSLSARAN